MLKMFKQNLKDLSKGVIIILLVIGIGMFAINQALGFYYKTHLLKSPCHLCVELNPEVEECMYRKEDVYPDGQGGWKPLFNTTELDNLIPVD